MRKSAELPKGISQKMQDFELWLRSERITKGTIKRYIERARNFMLYIGGRDCYDSQDARKYLANLKGESGWVRFNHYALKGFFDAMKWEWDLKHPPPETEHPKRLALSSEEITTLINAAKNGMLTERETGLLALSTIYGLRRVELMELRRDNVDFKHHTITIMTAKRGRMRTHLIPDEIFAYVQRFDFRVYEVSTLNEQFKSALSKCIVKHEDGMGWHSIRRRLYTEMKRRKIIYRKEFMRWKRKDIDDVYDVAMPEEIDREVFKNHPFLGAWK